MKNQSKLIERFFDAAGESDEAFLRALRDLVRAERASAGKSEVHMVAEPLSRLGRSTSADEFPHTVGEVIREVLRVNNWTVEEAARRLAVSVEIMESLRSQMMPLSVPTAAGVAAFLSAEFGIPDRLEFRQWLINGLRYLEIESHPNPPEGSSDHVARHAARRKKR